MYRITVTNESTGEVILERGGLVNLSTLDAFEHQWQEGGPVFTGQEVHIVQLWTGAKTIDKARCLADAWL